MSQLHIKKDDTVVVISGKDKGKQGKVMVALPRTGRVVVNGVAMVVRHTKPRQQGKPGGRIEKEGTIHASNVMLVCPNCKKPTRPAHAFSGDKKVRVCKKCGKNID